MIMAAMGQYTDYLGTRYHGNGCYGQTHSNLSLAIEISNIGLFEFFKYVIHKQLVLYLKGLCDNPYKCCVSDYIISTIK